VDSQVLGYLRANAQSRSASCICDLDGVFIDGGAMALLMCAELARPGLQFLSVEQDNQLFTRLNAFSYWLFL
jgi:heme/copper-type cytochrome/quinol oxidase subunit 1